MRDAVALAWSGRIAEAKEAAIEQASDVDPFVVGQGLEALATLGQQHDVVTDAQLDALLARAVTLEEPVSRRAYEAASALGSRAVETAACRQLEEKGATWAVLRYVGEWPSLALARALAAGWALVSDRLRDEALLTSRVLPVASREENDAWGQRAIASAGDRSEEVRLAAFQALWAWRPAVAAEACSRALEDDVQAVREAAALALAVIDVDRLIARALELEDEFPEPKKAIPLSAMVKFEAARRGS